MCQYCYWSELSSLGWERHRRKKGDAGSELAEFSHTDGEPLRKYKFPSFSGAKNGFISV